jgi:GNAT superfamily N-acetyltransferase
VDEAERIALGVVAAERARRANVDGAEVIELDGLVLVLSNLAEPTSNGVVVADRPVDAVGSLRAAEEAFERRGLTLGIELQAGRHPEVDAAVRSMGLSRILSRPGMAADPRRLDRRVPSGIEIRPVTTAEDIEALVRVGVAAFGDDPVFGLACYGAGARGVPGVRAFLGWQRDEPVAIATGYLLEPATVGVMGVGVAPAARGRGVGSAMTVAAATAFPGVDLAWLHPTAEAGSMYERLGFRGVSDWEVWVRRDPRP